MKLFPFETKQKKVLCWWQSEKYKDYNGIILDGAIRSGKTLSMVLSFLIWSMTEFNDRKFALCGFTIHAITKNIIKDLLEFCDMLGFQHKYNRSQNMITITSENTTNYFMIFGGGNEQSQDLIQGHTLAGVLFDEVALQKESFVNQATGRCSVDGSKYWFSCNPSTPVHYFKTDWIDKRDEKKLLYLHFTQEDNPSLSENKKQQYREMYTGSFYDRYIMGLWTAGEGVIYDMFGKQHIINDDEVPSNGRHYIAVDYGTKNATVFLHILQTPTCSYILHEYYYSGRGKPGEEGMSRQKTNSEYCKDLIEFKDNYCPRYECVIIDPSAASFKIELKNKIVVKNANNSVLEGIRLTGSLFAQNKIKIHERCNNLINELYSYSWKDTKGDKEEPLKENDHACDSLRYYISTIVKR